MTRTLYAYLFSLALISLPSLSFAASPNNLGYESAEHAFMGDEVILRGSTPHELTLDNGLKMTYGDIVAMPDYYGDPDHQVSSESTYFAQKKLGILLVCDTISPKTYRIGDTVIESGDQILQLHIPPRLAPTGQNNPLLADLTESLQLTSDYMQYQELEPKFVTGCTYEPLLRIVERRYGFKAYRVNIPAEWSERVRDVFHRYIDSGREPVIGFLYATSAKFQERFPPRVSR